MSTDVKPDSNAIIHVLLCDDDPQVLNELRGIAEKTLARTPARVLCTEQQDAAVPLPEQVEIAVLDVKLASASGIDVARRLLAANPDCQIIFISGYPEYVTDVYEIPHLCMILKDHLREFLPKFLLRAMASLRQLASATLSVTIHRTTLQVVQSDIVCIERQGHNSCIFCRSGDPVIVGEKLDLLMDRLSPLLFCRCHVSYIVNLQSVVSYQRRQFTLYTGTVVPISRVNGESAREKYMAFLREQV